MSIRIICLAPLLLANQLAMAGPYGNDKNHASKDENKQNAFRPAPLKTHTQTSNSSIFGKIRKNSSGLGADSDIRKNKSLENTGNLEQSRTVALNAVQEKIHALQQEQGCVLEALDVKQLKACAKGVGHVNARPLPSLPADIDMPNVKISPE